MDIFERIKATGSRLSTRSTTNRSFGALTDFMTTFLTIVAFLFVIWLLADFIPAFLVLTLGVGAWLILGALAAFFWVFPWALPFFLLWGLIIRLLK